MPTAVEVAETLYESWNAGGLATFAENVDAEVVLMQDPFLPTAQTLRGREGWRRWAARWDDGFEGLRVVPDALVAVDAHNVLALVSITATPAGAPEALTWAAAHVWTVYDGRICAWRAHLDLDAARATL